MSSTPTAVLVPYLSPGARVMDALKRKIVVDAALVLLVLVLKAGLAFLERGDFTRAAFIAAANALGIVLLKTAVELVLKYGRAVSDPATPVEPLPASVAPVIEAALANEPHA